MPHRGAALIDLEESPTAVAVGGSIFSGGSPDQKHENFNMTDDHKHREALVGFLVRTGPPKLSKAPSADDPDHAPRAPPPPEEKVSIFAGVLSGLICGMILFAFANVFSTLVFGQDPELVVWIPMGVTLNTASIFTSILISHFSGIPWCISGPDINPAIIYSAMAAKLVVLTDKDSLLPTLIFAMIISTLLMGIIFLLLGHFKLTRIVQFMPAIILRGFLGCIGYKIMKISLEEATGKKLKMKYMKAMLGSWDGGWELILPAMAIGFPLYFLKRLHIGSPTKVFPFFGLVPLIMFYFVLLGSGTSISEARDSGWFFPMKGHATFGDQWIHVQPSLVDSAALASVIPNIIVLQIICTLDVLLKLAGTEKVLGITINYNKEFKLTGLVNLLNGFIVATPGYGQTKFNVLNYGILRGGNSRLAGYVCAIFNGVLFFHGFPLINFMPRFFLSGLLMFSGMGFVAENLWDSFHTLTKTEFCAVWLIVITNAFSDLITAVGVGVVLATFVFAKHYARASPFRAQLSGADHTSPVIRPPEAERVVEHIARLGYHIVQLQSYIFFGSASRVHDAVSRLVEEKKKGKLAYLRYIILDFMYVPKVDAASMDVFVKISRVCKAADVHMLWTGLTPRLRQKLDTTSVVNDSNVFQELDLAIEFVEEQLLRWSAGLRSKWRVTDALAYVHRVAQINHISVSICHNTGVERGLFHDIKVHQLLDYCARKSLDVGEVLLYPDSGDAKLYFIQTGKLSVYLDGGDSTDHRRLMYTLTPGTFTNESSFWMEGANPYYVIARQPSVVLALTHQAFKMMEEKLPGLAFAIHRCVLKNTILARNKLHRQRAAGVSGMRYDDEENDEDLEPEDIALNSVVGAIRRTADGHQHRQDTFTVNQLAVSELCEHPPGHDKDSTDVDVHDEVELFYPPLPPSEIDRLKLTFKIFDTAGEGMVSRHDLGDIHDGLVFVQKYLNGQEPSDSTMQTSPESSTAISEEEFLKIVQCTRLAPLSSTLRTSLKKLLADTHRPHPPSIFEVTEQLKHILPAACCNSQHDLRHLAELLAPTAPERISYAKLLLLVSRTIQTTKIEHLLQTAFQRLRGVAPLAPIEKTDLIVCNSLVLALKDINCNLTNDEAQEMVAEADVYGQGGVNYREFRRIITEVESAE